VDKRFIEETFPVKEVSEFSSKERKIRHGQISSIHIWWTRKPSVPSRATNYAALIPAPNDEIDWIKKRNFIIELSKVENSNNRNIFEIAKKDILEANDNIPPKVLDPYSGGGTIPLEALKLGCETFASDYNPVAVLIEKCTLEYPQKYSRIKDNYFSNDKLINDINKWGAWVLDQSEKDLSKFYPVDENGLIPSSFIWNRTITCQNPSCEVEIPLSSNWWLSRTKKKKIALKPFIDNDKIEFEIIGQTNEIPKSFDPSKGTVSRAVVLCPKCGSSIDAKTTRRLFQEGKTNERMIAVVLAHPRKKGKIYRIANDKDLQTFQHAKKQYQLLSNELFNKTGIEPVPNEEIPLMSGTFNVPLYGMTKWGDLFNFRQKLSLITLIEKIKSSYMEMESLGYDKYYSKALITYLALAFDRTLTFSSNLTRWKSDAQSPVDVFARQALPMNYNYAENNPLFPHSGAFIDQVGRITFSLEKILTTGKEAQIEQLSATDLSYPDDFFDAVFTDPPYYNSVPYADLSDFFYVWLKRILGDFYKELFATPLSPKSKEIVEMAGWDKKRYSNKDKAFFEEMLKKSFQEIYRVLKPGGIATIIYAHKTTHGWETVINALLDSGLTVTASWPIHTEMGSRARAQRSAVLASTIYMITRKQEKKDIGWFKDTKKELSTYIPNKLDQLWEEGISGADFFIAAIGSAIEIFGKYKQVLDNQGNEIRADKILNFVRDIVTDYTVRQILHNGIADELSPLTKFYLLWRWNYQESQVSYDEARKLAQSAGIDLDNEWNKGFIKKNGEFIIVQGPNKREKTSLDSPHELIDVLHNLCLLWKEGKNDEMKFILKKSGYGEGETLYKVAQAISETLPNNSSEKKMIEGFLAGRDKIMQDIQEDEPQTKLV